MCAPLRNRFKSGSVFCCVTNVCLMAGILEQLHEGQPINMSTGRAGSISLSCVAACVTSATADEFLQVWGVNAQRTSCCIRAG